MECGLPIAVAKALVFLRFPDQQGVYRQ